MFATITADAMLRTARSYTEVPVFEGDNVEVVALAGGGKAQSLVLTEGQILCRVPHEGLLAVLAPGRHITARPCWT